MGNPKVLIVATSRKTRGGITSVIKAHETGEQWKKYHCTWIVTHRGSKNWWKPFYWFSGLVRFCCLVPFADIVHMHVSHGGSIKRKSLIMHIAKLFHCKTIVHFHPPGPFVLQNRKNVPGYKYLFQSADVVIVLSEQWKRWLKEYLCGEKSESWLNKLRVLYNPCPKVNRLNIPRKMQILLAGTIDLRKGYDVAIKAFGQIAKKYPDWRLLFAGIGDTSYGLKIAKDLGISNQVEFLGWVGGKQKEILFNETSIYCLASTGEGFPMAILDAWAYGIPCVMTPVGGIPDIVQDGKEGLVFDVGDVDGLAKCMEKLITDKSLREGIVRETDKYVDGLFNSQNINIELGKIYEQILNNK